MPLDWQPGKPPKPKRDWLQTLVVGFIVVTGAIVAGSLLAQLIRR